MQESIPPGTSKTNRQYPPASMSDIARLTSTRCFVFPSATQELVHARLTISRIKNFSIRHKEGHPAICSNSYDDLISYESALHYSSTSSPNLVQEHTSMLVDVLLALRLRVHVQA